MAQSTQRTVLDPYRTFAARDIKVGHITVDGIVLEVQTSDEGTFIRHRNVTYVQEPDSIVQVFGRIPLDVVHVIQETIGAGQQ